MTKCSLCLEQKETRYIDLYVFGSEGLRVCHDCEMVLVDFCRSLAGAALRKRKDEHKEEQ